MLGVKNTDNLDMLKMRIVIELSKEHFTCLIQTIGLKELTGRLPKGNHVIAVNK